MVCATDVKQTEERHGKIWVVKAEDNEVWIRREQIENIKIKFITPKD